MNQDIKLQDRELKPVPTPSPRSETVLVWFNNHICLLDFYVQDFVVILQYTSALTKRQLNKIVILNIFSNRKQNETRAHLVIRRGLFIHCSKFNYIQKNKATSVIDGGTDSQGKNPSFLFSAAFILNIRY
jgi:hypothetical protein